MAYAVRLADPIRDRTSVVALWTRHLQLAFPDRWYDWAHTRNPAANGPNWLLECDGRPVGTSGIIPRRFVIGDRDVTAGRIGGFGVDSDHRFLGPAALLQKALLGGAVPGCVDMLYSSAPPELVGLFTRLGYECIGPLVRYVRPLNADTQVSRVVGGRVVTRAAAGIVRAALRAWAALQWRPGCLESLETFDDRLDELWSRSRPFYGVTGVRTRETLVWRFGDIPTSDCFRLLAVAHPGTGRLVGYAVVIEQDRTWVVADLFAEEPHTALDVVLLALVRGALASEATGVSVKCLALGPLDRALRRCGFRPRDDGPPMSVIASPGWRTLAGGVRAGDLEWFFVGGDDFWS